MSKTNNLYSISFEIIPSGESPSYGYIININDGSLVNQSGTLNQYETKFNKSCYIINGYNFETKIINETSVFGIDGLITFNNAQKRVNNKSLTKNQLYSLYVNKNIKKLSDISFGINYSDISNTPNDRESLDCSINNNSDINMVINKDNFKLFTNLKYVASNYPNLLKNSHKSELGLKKHNQKVLNNYLYNNIFPNLNKKKEYSYFANNKNMNIKRIIPSSFQKNIRYNPSPPPPNYVMRFKKCK
jgi:hypothetical protein